MCSSHDVDDLIKGFDANDRLDQRFFSLVKIRYAEEFSMVEFAERGLRIIDSIFKLMSQLLPQYKPKRCRPDTEIVRSGLGWAPTVGLDQGG